MTYKSLLLFLLIPKALTCSQEAAIKVTTTLFPLRAEIPYKIQCDCVRRATLRVANYDFWIAKSYNCGLSKDGERLTATPVYQYDEKATIKPQFRENNEGIYASLHEALKKSEEEDLQKIAAKK